MGNELNYSLWLNSIERVGTKKIGRLLSVFGTAENIFMAKETDFDYIEGISEEDKHNILYRRNADELLRMQQELLRKEITFLSLEDRDYPEKLRNIVNPPYGIYIRGKVPGPGERAIAIVGSRMCSPYGKSIAIELANALAANGVSVISGMARGIDSHAHKGSLGAGGKTYAVLAGGVDVIYPPEHRMLYEDILLTGGIISENPPGFEPLKGMFPLRNRIISALSDAVVIVEAKRRSGSLITADCALEQGKDVYVVPGRINDPLSAGCNSYIKQGADIIDSIPGFLEQLQLSYEAIQTSNNNKKISLEKEESIVYSCLRLTPCSFQELMTMTELDLLTVIRCINRLEELGLAEEYYKNHYIRSA